MNKFGTFSKEILEELNKKRYHFLNTSLSEDNYPNKFPAFKKISEIKIGKIYTVRAFIKLKPGINSNVDSGLMDINIIRKTDDYYEGEILTNLPKNFPLSKGQIVNFKKEEILYEI
jgi:hypothetical protein